jgi:cyclic pyranopterin phosphate synthase
MVDVGSKPESSRVAIAVGKITMTPETFKLIHKNQIKKGDVLTVAKITGIQGAKQTSNLIPLCHPLLLSKIDVNFTLNEPDSTIHISASVSCVGRTGVEMEALSAVSTAALTIFDMCKAVDRGMVISDIRVIEKKGGKSGHFTNP